MAVVDPKSIRQRIAASIASALPTYSETRDPPPLFPDGPNQQQANRALAHLGYAVSLGQTVETRSEGRQDASVGVWCQTTVHVVFGHRLRVEASVADYDEALDIELAIVASVMLTDNDPGLHPRFSRAIRTVTADGELFVGQVDFTALHHYSLTG